MTTILGFSRPLKDEFSPDWWCAFRFANKESVILFTSLFCTIFLGGQTLPIFEMTMHIFQASIFNNIL